MPLCLADVRHFLLAGILFNQSAEPTAKAYGMSYPQRERLDGQAFLRARLLCLNLSCDTYGTRMRIRPMPYLRNRLLMFWHVLPSPTP